MSDADHLFPYQVTYQSRTTFTVWAASEDHAISQGETLAYDMGQDNVYFRGGEAYVHVDLGHHRPTVGIDRDHPRCPIQEDDDA